MAAEEVSKQTGVRVKLVGEDGNAFSILGRVSREMRNAGIPKETIDQYVREATSGDYNNLLRVTLSYVEEAGNEDDEWEEEEEDYD